MPSWPTELPFFHGVEGMTRTGPQGEKLRSAMSAGPDKVRRRSSAGVLRRSGALPGLSSAQLAAFEAFYLDDLKGGVLAFDAADCFDGAVRSFRFVESYEVTRSGGQYTVAAELEVLP